jgi:hypothetical protein
MENPRDLAYYIIKLTTPRKPQAMEINLHEIANDAKLFVVPRELLNQETLNKKGELGESVYWMAASRGCLDQIPPEHIKLEYLREKTPMGKNSFHAAALTGNIKQIPKEFLTWENLSIPDQNGYNCLHMLALRGNLKDIPKEILTIKNLSITNNIGMSAYHSATKGGQIKKILEIDPTLINQEIVEKEITQSGMNLLHLAAHTETIEDIPPSLFKHSNLLKEDKDGNTTLHIAALAGCLDQIPKKFLDEKSLLKSNKAGLYPMDYEPEKITAKFLKSLERELLEKISKVINTKKSKDLIKKELVKRLALETEENIDLCNMQGL